MVLLVLSYLGGLLTILSPCILPVLPFVFTRADQPFWKSGFPLLLGMAATFALASSLAVVGGEWVSHANEYGRWIALTLLFLFALTLLFPNLSEHVTQPLTRLGGKLNHSANATASNEGSFFKSFVLGIATGLLWAPCAGPILGLILTGAALQGASVRTWTFLLAYALGAATSLAVALLAGATLFKSLKKYLVADKYVRRILGIVVLLGIATIALGWDRTLLTKLSKVRTESVEQTLIGYLSPEEEAKSKMVAEGEMPELMGANQWMNSPALTRENLKGNVVLIDFWTYSCINCLRTLPYVRAWHEKYKQDGLIVIGVHTPEFAFEKSISNVQKAIAELNIIYPVAIDNDYAIWGAFRNRYWPAHYFVDAKGMIRFHHFGEGNYEESEKNIQRLLAERNGKSVDKKIAGVNAQGVEAASNTANVKSPETYLGSDRSKNYVSSSKNLQLNQWTLTGKWNINEENATLTKASGKIIFRFHARDLHLVLGPGTAKKPIRFTVKIDGASPSATEKGIDLNDSGSGEVREHRLYQLIRQNSREILRERTFEIEFLDPGVQAYAFTFG